MNKNESLEERRAELKRKLLKGCSKIALKSFEDEKIMVKF